jgi:hypothetical protein
MHYHSLLLFFGVVQRRVQPLLRNHRLDLPLSLEDLIDCKAYDSSMLTNEGDYENSADGRPKDDDKVRVGRVWLLALVV